MPPAAMVLAVPASVRPFDAMNGIFSSFRYVYRLAASQPLDWLRAHLLANPKEKLVPRVLWNSNLREGSDPVRRPVPAVDPRAGDLRACGKARRASALGHLLARPSLRARHYHHRPFLARAIRVVRPFAVGREGRCPSCRRRSDPPRRNTKLRAKGR